MAYERRSFEGAAAVTALESGISNTSTSMTIENNSGWPTGSQGEFFIVIDRGQANEEKIRVATQASGVLTVASGGRGADDTTAVAHAGGAVVEHCGTAFDFDEANQAVTETLGTITTPEDLLVADSATSFKRLPIGSNGDLLRVAAGVLGYGAIPAGAISSSGMFAAGVVDSAAIATDAVGSAEIAADAVGTSEIADDAVTADQIADNAVTAAAIAADAVGTTEIADDAVTLAKLASEAWTAATPPTVGGTGWALGNGTAAGRYVQMGRLVIYNASVIWGSTSTFGTGRLTLSVPVANAAKVTLVQVICFDASSGFFWDARGVLDNSASVVDCYSPVLATPGRFENLTEDQPFTWVSTDAVYMTAIYEAAS